MQEWIDFTRQLALASGKLILEHYGTALQVVEKPDLSPVTIADRQAEALMRSMIEAHYPDHQVLGEEEGLSGKAGSDFQWVLDPIDGTRCFVHRVPLFGTLIALLERGVPILGAIHLPTQGELMIGARGRPTQVNGTAVRVRPTARLEQATVLYTSTREWWQHGHAQAFQRLQERAALIRGWGDCFGHFQVAAGRADVMIDPILKIWDVAALKPCVEGAGGRLTDMHGQEGAIGESAVSSNGLLHEGVLATLHG
ncbi:MAG TPA: inositol monophosphatase family protein [bacterium]|nr:inositol monophosphatase family protein [bacterium]